MADEIDYSDPCAVLAELRPAYYKLLAGSKAVRVSFSDRTVDYSQTNLPLLRTEIARLESECAAKSGDRPKRRALQAGTRRFI
jgi:hypothetical protein